MKNLKIIALLLFTANFAYTQTPTSQGEGAGTQGNYGTYYGYNAGQSATGENNIYVGTFAGQNSGTGRFNVAIGTNALNTNTTGQNNVMIGTSAGANNGVGGDNVFLGAFAGNKNNSGYDNVMLGATAGANIVGNRNILIGRATGNALTSGTGNIFIGYQAGALLDNISNKLYIQNSNDTEKPLIYGDFQTGQVGIETSYVPGAYKLAVNGDVIAEEIQVMERIHWPDYVFDDDYNLLSLPELETKIESLGHLPGVPSAEEVNENGHALGKMDAILLEKVEELTLHLIDMNKNMERLNQENKLLKKEISELKK